MWEKAFINFVNKLSLGELTVYFKHSNPSGRGTVFFDHWRYATRMSVTTTLSGSQ